MRLFFLIIFSPLLCFSQADRKSIQDSVWNLYIDYALSKTEKQRTENSEKFSSVLKFALSQQKSNEFSFDSLRQYRVMLESPDKEVRVFSWNVEAEDGTQKFYGYIQAFNKKSQKHEVYQLIDKSDGMKDPENAVLDITKWHGAYYYQIIQKKYKKKKYYVLLGWDGNNRITNKRLIEVLSFDGKGFPKFGDNILSAENGKIKKRIIFEYQAGIIMSLRYDKDKDMIIFDHLSPSNPDLVGMYQFYGPDFSYDGLQFKEGKWIYVKNVDIRNEKDNTDRFFNTPK